MPIFGVFLVVFRPPISEFRKKIIFFTKYVFYNVFLHQKISQESEFTKDNWNFCDQKRNP